MQKQNCYDTREFDVDGYHGDGMWHAANNVAILPHGNIVFIIVVAVFCL